MKWLQMQEVRAKLYVQYWFLHPNTQCIGQIRPYYNSPSKININFLRILFHIPQYCLYNFYAQCKQTNTNILKYYQCFPTSSKILSMEKSKSHRDNLHSLNIIGIANHQWKGCRNWLNKPNNFRPVKLLL